MSGLTKKQLERFTGELEQRAATLRREIEAELKDQADERFRDLAGDAPDRADEAIAAEIGGLDNALIGRHVAAVRDIEAALQRIAEGSFGICTDCGGAIGVTRLKAFPTAKRCGRCQRRYELSRREATASL